MFKHNYCLFLCSVIIFIGCQQKESNTLQIHGIQEPVEIIRDQWGINHMYATIKMICCLPKDIVRPKTGHFNLKSGEGKQQAQSLNYWASVN